MTRITETRLAPDQSGDLGSILATASGGRWSRNRRRIALAVAAIVIAAAGYAWLGSSRQPAAPTWRTEPAQRGDLTVTVSATGNVQPTNQVDVGSELSGIIDAVLVEENDRVRQGQVLAQLDVSKLQDAIAKSKGALAAAQAQVAQTVATVREKKLAYDRLVRMAAISKGGIPSQADIDTAQAALERARADETAARANVEQAGATLRSDQTSLTKASIRSPIDGVVLARKVEPGQTVAASLQAPVLFTLAENLSQMRIEVDVDEADVGQVHDGQQATFTVDAYPNRHYPARITRVDYGSQVKDGVVSYLTVLAVDNDDLSLRPGMTATAEITTQQVSDALLVPAAALRFTPPQAEAAAPSGGITSMLPPRLPRSTPTRSGNAAGTQRVWVLRNGVPVAVPVKTGASDGRHTQIVAGELAAGTPVVTELAGGAR